MKAIYFDMDGTLANLYGYPNWLNLLHAEDTTPYEKAKPLCDMRELHDILMPAIAAGITIGIISWGAMGGSREYGRATRKAKREWVKQYMPYVSEFHTVKYGTAKHRTVKYRNSILVDDNAEVRAAWTNGATIDATNTEEMLNNLAILVDSLATIC